MDVTQSTAKSILCQVKKGLRLLGYVVVFQAYLRQKYYPGYAWIIINNFAESRWWTDQILYNDCTTEQVKTVLNYSFLIGIHPNGNVSIISIFLKIVYLDSPSSIEIILVTLTS